MTGALFPLTFASEEFRLLTGLVLGFLFGFVLERAGFGNARKLAGQFYLNDMTVFKVMFTAILVAMVGLFGLQAVGLADISMMWINPTFMPAQAVGGFLLGVGFIMSGLCPGTSVVSMATGRLDGLVYVGGFTAGTLGFAVGYPVFEDLLTMGDLGVLTLPEVTGISWGIVAFGVVLMAIGGFAGATWVERWTAAKADTAPSAE